WGDPGRRNVISGIQLDNADVITFHSYGKPADFEARIAGEASKKTLQEKLPKLDGATKLAFRVGQKDLVSLIPDCMTAQEKRDKVLGKTDDLWDRGFSLPRWLTGWAFDAPQTLSYVLLVVVVLLSVEWLTRKLLRLA
ncbi:MAG: hypothetical protein K2P78_03480, partial [Gemmataceae bacterium]|nr:hypothetical protein [Gemmataceae bacterium]